jgi:hypothetical protein
MRRDSVPTLLPSESAAAAATPADVVAAPPLATMLTRHILRDGELIVLTLKPSVWYIPFSSLRFCAVVLIVMIAAQILNEQLSFHVRTVMELGALALAGRLMWALLQWMSRLYILTDLRVVALSGIFTADIFDCPLRKIARVRIVSTMKERPLNVGSIEIIPFDDSYPVGIWQMVPRPREVHKVIVSTMNRAKQGAGPLGG